MVAGCGAKLSKLILFIFNFALWITSLALIGLGIWVLVSAAKFEAIFSDDNISLVGGIMLGVGVFAFFVGFCGCCGAMKESLCLLRMYFLFMGLIIVAEVTGGILAFVFKAGIEDSMTSGMTSAITNQYGQTSAATEAIDFVQKEFDCCGANNSGDYVGSQYELKHGLGSLPDSCCSPDTASGTCKFTSPTKYTEGCVAASINTIEDNVVIVGLVCFGFILVEIFAMVFVCCMTSAVKTNSYTNFA